MTTSPPADTPTAGPTGPDRPTRRSPFRALLETRGHVGGHDHPHVHVRFSAADGTPLVATYLPGPGELAPAIVLLHGFAAHRRKPAYALLADHLAAHAHVLAVDLRGHGHSGGLTTLGDREALDADAAVAWLRARGHQRVVLMGASMGATTLLHAIANGTVVDAAVAISGPAILEEEPASAAMQRLKRIWESPAARAAMRWGLRVRVVPPSEWRHPGDPQQFAASVTVPLLVVHGADDAYFPVADGEIRAAAAPRSALWVEPQGFGHAEDGFSPQLADRLGRAVVTALDSGCFPARTEEVSA